MPLFARRAFATVGVSVIALLSAPAMAFEFEEGDIKGSFDTTLTMGALFRLQKPDANLIGAANGGTGTSINGDDGNLNYDRGLASLVARATHDLKLESENVGFFNKVGGFLRTTYFYDFVNANGNTEFRDLSNDAIQGVGRDIKLLDAFVYGDFTIADEHPISIRFGNQVLSWGESTFIQNGVNVINPFDVGALRVPGTELKEGLLPVPMIDIKGDINENLSLEAFYQFQWERTRLEPAGTMFSTNDFASDGGNGVFLGFGNAAIPDITTSVKNAAITPLGSRVPRGPDDRPSNQGQFGFAARYYSPELNDTEFGAYFINYHSRVPVISAHTGSVGDLVGFTAADYASGSYYTVEYPENIKLFGLSFNTSVDSLGVALQGEYTFRWDQPLQVDDVELLQAALAPAAVTGNCAAGAATVACQRTLAVFNTNQIIREMGGITAANAGRMLDIDMPGFRLHDVSQGQMTATKIFGPTFGGDALTLVGEFGLTHVHNLPSKGTLRYDGPGTSVGGNAAFIGVGGMPYALNEGFADATSMGYRVRAKLDYLNAIGPVSLSPVVSFSHDVSGTTPLPLGNFIEGRKAVSLGLAASYQSNLTAEVGYTTYYGAGDFNQINDRDFVAFSVKYSF